MTKFQVSMKRWFRPADLSANSISTALWVFCGRQEYKTAKRQLSTKTSSSKAVESRQRTLRQVLQQVNNHHPRRRVRQQTMWLRPPRVAPHEAVTTLKLLLILLCRHEKKLTGTQRQV